jgi:hypothetical protein
VEIRGDAAKVLGILACDPKRNGPTVASYVRDDSCEVVDVFVPAGGVTGYLETDCD